MISSSFLEIDEQHCIWEMCYLAVRLLLMAHMNPLNIYFMLPYVHSSLSITATDSRPKYDEVL